MHLLGNAKTQNQAVLVLPVAPPPPIHFGIVFHASLSVGSLILPKSSSMSSTILSAFLVRANGLSSPFSRSVDTTSATPVCDLSSALPPGYGSRLWSTSYAAS